MFIVHILTCHQELNAPLCWHLLSGMVGDQVEHVGSAVGPSEVGHPQGAVFRAWFSQVLHPVLIGWIGEDASAVEHVPDKTYKLKCFHKAFASDGTRLLGIIPLCDAAAVFETPHVGQNLVLLSFASSHLTSNEFSSAQH